MCQPTQQSQGFKQSEAYRARPPLGLNRVTTGPTQGKEKTVPLGLFGQPTETEVKLNGQTVKTLLDTGSTVFTISNSYYNTQMKKTKLQNINSLLDIECGGG